MARALRHAGIVLVFGALAALGRVAAQPHDPIGREPEQEDGNALKLESPAFHPNGEIPRKHTCEGGDVAPPLAWSGVPEQAQSLVLIVEDPDAPDPAAPRMTFTHWLLFNIPKVATGIPQGGSPLPEGTQQGENDFHREGYGGPCPPIGRHRYFFKLYALDTTLALEHANRAKLLAAIEGHVLAHTELIGTYQKAKAKPKH
jgi:Raf kinase inhibitor-like YbhB/YbcL family protein